MKAPAAAGLGLALAAAGPAAAAEPEVWASLEAARVLQSVDRDPAAAAAAYEAVLGHLSEDDPQRAETVVWLARARLESGDEAAAARLWAEAAQHPRTRAEARAWLGWMQLERQRVTALPHVEGFGAGPGAVVRGWTRGQDGDLTTIARDGLSTGALAWRINVADGEDDFVALAIDPAAGPLGALRARLRAEGFEAWVLVVVVDSAGRRWTSATPFRVPVGEWRELSVDAAALTLADGPTSTPLDPSAALRVEWVDVTAFNSRSRGDHWLFFDELALLSP